MFIDYISIAEEFNPIIINNYSCNIHVKEISYRASETKNNFPNFCMS